jgi:hypothetical protein
MRSRVLVELVHCTPRQRQLLIVKQLFDRGNDRAPTRAATEAATQDRRPGCVRRQTLQAGGQEGQVNPWVPPAPTKPTPMSWWHACLLTDQPRNTFVQDSLTLNACYDFVNCSDRSILLG